MIMLLDMLRTVHASEHAVPVVRDLDTLGSFFYQFYRGVIFLLTSALYPCRKGVRCKGKDIAAMVANSFL